MKSSFLFYFIFMNEEWTLRKIKWFLFVILIFDEHEQSHKQNYLKEIINYNYYQFIMFMSFSIILFLCRKKRRKFFFQFPFSIFHSLFSALYERILLRETTTRYQNVSSPSFFVTCYKVQPSDSAWKSFNWYEKEFSQQVSRIADRL